MVTVDYTKSYNRLSGRSEINIENDSFNGRLEYRFLPSWIIDTNFEYYQIKSSSSSSEEPYLLLNGSVRYELASSAWSFTGSVNNALNNRVRTGNSISDYMTMEQAYHVLPRILLLGVSYKL